ncbi:hypothetical protein BT93_H2488 [Corymbia citriodora subsp. variegata]|nr:hypothetical protein BT93_H2488 [Corymbia citriodora subsp. variegata]
MGGINKNSDDSLINAQTGPPAVAPPLPGPLLTRCARKGLQTKGLPQRGDCCISTTAIDLWERLFDQGYKADVQIHTDGGGVVYAHACIISMASPVMKGMLKKSKRKGHYQILSIHGVSDDAIRVFVRFLYSSCYQNQDLADFVVPLLVLSHSFVVPRLKQICEQQLEQGLLNTENVVDIFQLALLCDAPRLSFICHHMIVKNFKDVSTTEGWAAMKQSHPLLEKGLQECVLAEDNRKKERIRRKNERKIYLQLYEAMEALVHICRDGCRTIGPHDKVFKKDQPPCSFEACKGLELLIRHFAGCKLRVPGGCIHCKRMWQLLELHSRLCADSDVCRVPLCRNFKDRIKKQNKKDKTKWRMLARKILRTKTIGVAPFFTSAYER